MLGTEAAAADQDPAGHEQDRTQSAFRLALTVGKLRTQRGRASRLARATSASSAARIVRFEEPDDPALGPPGPGGRCAIMASAPVGSVGGGRFRQAELEAILDEVVDRRLGARQEPPAIGRRTKPLGILRQDGRRVVFGVDRDADSRTLRPRESAWRPFITLEMRGHDRGQRVKMNEAIQTRSARSA